jgi:phage terminase large subunit GpA-like protein
LSAAEPFEGADDIRRAWLAGLAPDPALTVSQWADRHRVLSSRSASEAGPYRTSRTPYMRGIMDALSPRNPVQRVVFMKAAQVGATEAGNNWIGFCIHRAPGPFLAVQPTVELDKRLSQQRIDPLIEESPDLRALVMASRSRDSGNTILGKRFPGGQLLPPDPQHMDDAADAAAVIHPPCPRRVGWHKRLNRRACPVRKANSLRHCAPALHNWGRESGP